MNILEYEMIEVLKKLKNDFGVFQIKAEYENEGSRQVELMRLKDVADYVGLPIILKIGGCEAVTDMYEALSIGAKGIIAPMVETAFATSKFLDAIDKFIAEDNRKDIEFAINVETISAVLNFDKMLELEKIHLLDSITFGRVDFTGSLGHLRDFAESDSVLEYATSVFKKAKLAGLRTAIGGAISLHSFPFIKTLINSDLLDKYETRKLVYHPEGIETYIKGIQEGIKFELLWLKSKRRYYHKIAIEDEKRIKMLEERIND
jgi:2-keto-3-deoxy-L-rhamnonate aldolase RhmA